MRSTTFLAFLLYVTVANAAESTPADVVLKGGTLVDGTGAPRRLADVALKGDRIVALGSFAFDPKARVIDATGLVIAPGFIDLHSHSDEPIVIARTRGNINYQTQGVTTIVTGNCGGGTLDASKYFDSIDQHGAGANVIHLVPLGDVRSSVMGNAERKPTAAELDKMRALVEKGMRAGAWGVSSGLIYMPGRYADVKELTALAKVAARHGGIYASHIRDESAGLVDSVDEAIAVGDGAKLPVHISHLKASGKPYWGLTAEACKHIEAARKAGKPVTADQYPYIASSTSLAAMVIPHWALQGNTAEFTRIADDPEQGPRLRRAIQADLDTRDDGASIRLARYGPKTSRVGKNLVQIAEAEGVTPLDVVIDVQKHGGAQAISFGMDEADVRFVMTRDYVATASDASSHLPNGNDQPHPRAYGTFPRKIRYALDDKVLSLEAAVRSCTGLPASILKIPDRGVIRVGAYADLAVFDPATFRDLATFDKPIQYAAGLKYLFINGVPAIDAAKPRKVLPGRALRLHKEGPADLILNLGRIWTGDPAHPWAESLAARNGKIVALGSKTDVAPYLGPNTRAINNPDAFATPGLVDAHVHLSELGAGLEEIDLRGVASLEEVARRVKTRLDLTSKEKDAWITGQSWDQSLWPGGAFPNKSTLDAVAPDRPVWLRRVDGHAGWANSEALRRAGVTRTTRATSDGQILHDPSGEPTGVLVDGAMDLVSKNIPPASKSTLERRILAAQAIVLKAGLTGVHDAGVSRLEAEAYHDLDRAGKLTLRVYGMASSSETGAMDLLAKPPVTPSPSSRFQLRAVKVYIDGAMGSRGALMFESYADDPGNSGLPLIEPAALEKITTDALKQSWQVCTHAIGDKGNALVLDAYAAALKSVPSARDPRLRIEHAQVVRRSDVPRFKSLGVIASMQPSHAVSDMRWADARLGPGRTDGAYAWRWFLDDHVPLAFGSDFPVEIVNPLYGVHSAITRQDEKSMPPGGWHPAQRISMEETLRAFTAGSAYASFSESHLGVLKPGMTADLTLFDHDLFTIQPPAVLTTKVLAAVINGVVVFEN